MKRVSKNLVGVAAVAAVISAVELWRWWQLTAATASVCMQPTVPAGVTCNHSTELFIGLAAGLLALAAVVGAVLAGIRRRQGTAPVV